MRLLPEATRATPFSFPTYQSVRETLGYPQVLFRSPLDHEEVFADVNSVGMTQDYLAVDTHNYSDANSKSYSPFELCLQKVPV